MKRAVVIGYSGHSYVIIDILLTRNYIIRGYCESTPKADNPYGLIYLGLETDREVLNSIKSDHIFVAIGDNRVRRAISENFLRLAVTLPSIFHPSSVISPTVALNHGCAVMAGVVINSLVTMGKGVVFNTSSIVEHECKIGNYVHIGPGATLAGNVVIGNNSFVGANSVIKQGVNIGNNVVVGAGAVVIRDVEDDKVVIGNPAKVYRY